MLESLELFNFRKHEHIKLEFDPHITTIVGSSNSGKTGFLGGLKWTCQNRPLGISLIRRGQNNAKGVLCADGHKVIRERRPDANYFQIDNKLLHFDTVNRRDVPEQISDVLKISEESWAGQHDAPFLFQLTPGQVGQALNEIIDLGLIDSTLGNLATELRNTKTEVDRVREQLHQDQVEQKRLAWTEDAALMFSHLIELQERADVTKRKHERALTLVETKEKAEKKVEKLSAMVQDMETVVKSLKTVAELTEKIDRLQNFLKKTEQLRKEMSIIIKERKEVTAKLEAAMQERCPACGRGT